MFAVDRGAIRVRAQGPGRRSSKFSGRSWIKGAHIRSYTNSIGLPGVGSISSKLATANLCRVGVNSTLVIMSG